MQIYETFGNYVDQWSRTDPQRARWLLKTGWEVQDIRYRVLPQRELMPADRYLARVMMDRMLQPLKRPEQSAVVSIFTPCELLQEVGLSPYNVEGFSSYISASCAGQGCLQQAENSGISETLCSYHKTFIGAAERGLLPKPRCVVYTNLTCDANLVTFRHLAQLFDVPSFAIDVPMQQNEENVEYVAGQLREMAAFLEKCTGTAVDEARLKERMRRSRRTLENYERFQELRMDRYVPSDLVTPMFAGIANQLFLGTKEQEAYTEMLLREVRRAEPAAGKRIYWMHTIPFWSEAVKKELSLQRSAQIVGCEMSEFCSSDFEPEHPYEAMAKRMVYNGINGSVIRRIERGIESAKRVRADGAVWFCHWGCKHTLGGAQLAKKRFEAAGIPLLILDGDGCDQSHGGEGQTSTRLGAFLEMLQA